MSATREQPFRVDATFRVSDMPNGTPQGRRLLPMISANGRASQQQSGLGTAIG